MIILWLRVRTDWGVDDYNDFNSVTSIQPVFQKFLFFQSFTLNHSFTVQIKAEKLLFDFLIGCMIFEALSLAS